MILKFKNKSKKNKIFFFFRKLFYDQLYHVKLIFINKKIINLLEKTVSKKDSCIKKYSKFEDMIMKKHENVMKTNGKYETSNDKFFPCKTIRFVTYDGIYNFVSNFKH